MLHVPRSHSSCDVVGMAQEPLTPFGDALAGALGASFANISTYPLDV